TVHIQILLVRACTGERWAHDHAVERYQTMQRLHRKALFTKLGAEHILNTFGNVDRPPMALRLVVVKKPKGDVVLSQRDSPEHLHAVAVFCGFGLQKFSTGGNVVKQLTDIDGRAAWTRRGLGNLAGGSNLPGMVVLCGARGNGD